MRLAKVQISNYRSITKKSVLILDDYSILLGKNNEGKSNILNAVFLAFETIRGKASMRKTFGSPRWMRQRLFDFDIDYPLELKKRGERYCDAHPTQILLSFALAESERKELYKETRVRCRSTIDIVASFSKAGPALHVLYKRNDESVMKGLFRFLVSRFDIIFIPTIRTSDQSMRAIERIVNNGMNSLGLEPDYQEALSLIRKRENEKLDEISKNLLPVMQQFLPSVKSLNLFRQWRPALDMFREDLDFVIDDGHETSIEYKGDGIKSLVQIALLKETSNASQGLIMVEEPESHLHPGAIHELKAVLQDISERRQVIVTTHNPIFVNQISLQSNHIVNGDNCKPAATLDEIRRVLGVQFADSLFSSECVVFVEGETDIKVLSHLLFLVSPLLKQRVEEGALSFFAVGGAAKIPSALSFASSLLLRYFVVFDNDQAGKASQAKCFEQKLISNRNHRFIPTIDKKEAELEDLLRPELTAKLILEKYNAQLPDKFKNKKWSQWVSNGLERIGHSVQESTILDLKCQIADDVQRKKDLDQLVIPPKKEFLEDLAAAILNYFDFATAETETLAG